MKFIYPAIFRPTEDKKYNAFFPDLACCEAQGDTLDDAIENANAAAYDWIYTELMEFEGKLPPVSDESDLKQKYQLYTKASESVTAFCY